MESDSDSDVNVFGDSSEEEVSATIRASSERIPTKVVNDAVVRFVCGYKLYQVAVADVCDRNEALIYTEVIYRCQKTKCQKRVWTNIAAECDKQNYSRETVAEHNHQGEPIKMEVLVIVDKALRIVNQNPLTTNRDIIAAALEGAIDEVRFAVNTQSLGHRLTLFKQNLFPRGSFAPADLIIPEGWSVHTDGSQFIFFDSGLSKQICCHVFTFHA